MPTTRPPYASAFREQMVGLVRSGRSPEELAREFEPSARSSGPGALVPIGRAAWRYFVAGCTAIQCRAISTPRANHTLSCSST